MWYPVHAINLNLLQVKGRSDLFLKLEIAKKIVGVSMLCITLPFGLIPVCWGVLANSIIALVINTYYTGKLIRLGFMAQMRDLLPSFLLSIITGFSVWITLQLLSIAPVWQLIIGVIEGTAIYTGIAYIFKFKEFQELADIIHKR